jgi:hypothetical protein
VNETPQRHPLTGLIRDAATVTQNLVALDTGELLTKVPTKIHIPVRYTERNLAQIGIDTFIYGIYALIMEDRYYAVSNVNALVQIDPYKVVTEKVDGVEYHAFHFEPHTVLIKNLNVVQRDTLIYDILDEFIFKGKVPWYLGYDDLGRLFDTAQEYAGSNIVRRYEVLELIVGLIARLPEDRSQYYRTQLQSRDELLTRPPVIVPLNSVFWSARNTLSKVAGAYFNDAIVSALVTPTTSTERIESLLRA